TRKTITGIRMRIVCSCLVLLVTWVGPRAVSNTTRGGDTPASRRQPNILFLLSDDQRAVTIAALGNRHIHTPNLDSLVREGTAFTRALCPSPLCVPSRAEILTGCTGFKNGVLPDFSMRLNRDLMLWPQVLRGGGYHTWYVGKWHTEGRPSGSGY